MLETDVAMQLKETHNKLAQVMHHKINEYDLKMGQLHLSMLVKRFPDKSQKELAREMRFTEGAMSHSVKKLIGEGILEQISLETDMRYNRLVLTQKGDSFINEYEQYVTKVYRDLFIDFQEKELVILDKLLKRINKNIEKISNILNQNI
ncbi:MAG: winged helix DNA-binding protein [Clostridiales bacterium]|nr:winged helix DNA-binding protein [Clostridiales bacterium]